MREVRREPEVREANVVADLEKSALMRIARLMNSLAKGTKRMVTKVQWLC